MPLYLLSLSQIQSNLFSKVSIRAWLLSASIMVALGCLFHFAQNSGTLVGGSVPFVKSAWLFTVLFYWYVMPAIWLSDTKLAKPIKLVLGISLANMVLRALFELPLMYVTASWLHAYGIGHDIFSVALSLILLLWLVRNSGKGDALWVKWYLCVSALLFLVESYFALYLRSVTDADGSVFFLPSSPSNTVILATTAAAVLLAWAAIVYILSLSHD